jgi:hypothetical protein
LRHQADPSVLEWLTPDHVSLFPVRGSLLDKAIFKRSRFGSVEIYTQSPRQLKHWRKKNRNGRIIFRIATEQILRNAWMICRIKWPDPERWQERIEPVRLLNRQTVAISPRPWWIVAGICGYNWSKRF